PRVIRSVFALQYVNEIHGGYDPVIARACPCLFGFRAAIEHPSHRLAYLLILAMDASYPAAGPPHPFVPGERRDVFPFGERLRRNRERFPQICRETVYDAAGDGFRHSS